jgi:hypothetical protein
MTLNSAPFFESCERFQILTKPSRMGPFSPHNPKVVGSNPARATSYGRLTPAYDERGAALPLSSSPSRRRARFARSRGTGGGPRSLEARSLRSRGTGGGPRSLETRSLRLRGTWGARQGLARLGPPVASTLATVPAAAMASVRGRYGPADAPGRGCSEHRGAGRCDRRLRERIAPRTNGFGKHAEALGARRRRPRTWPAFRRGA